MAIEYKEPMSREHVVGELAQTLIAEDGAGSDLTDPYYEPGAFENRVEIDQGNGGTIDIDHLASDVLRMIDTAVADTLDNIALKMMDNDKIIRDSNNMEAHTYLRGRADTYQSVWSDLQVLANKFRGAH